MGVESTGQLVQGTEVVHLQVILVEPASATNQPEPPPCGPRRGVLAVRDLLLQELLRADVIEEQRAVASAHGDDVLIEAERAHTRAAPRGSTGTGCSGDPGAGPGKRHGTGSLPRTGTTHRSRSGTRSLCSKAA